MARAGTKKRERSKPVMTNPSSAGHNTHAESRLHPRAKYHMSGAEASSGGDLRTRSRLPRRRQDKNRFGKRSQVCPVGSLQAIANNSVSATGAASMRGVHVNHGVADERPTMRSKGLASGPKEGMKAESGKREAPKHDLVRSGLGSS